MLASPEQAKIITGFENDGSIHVALITRNNDKLAEGLLAKQDETLAKLYPPASDSKQSTSESNSEGE